MKVLSSASSGKAKWITSKCRRRVRHLLSDPASFH